MAIKDVAAWAAVGLSVVNGLYNFGYRETDLSGVADTIPIDPAYSNQGVGITATVPLQLLNGGGTSVIVSGIGIKVALVDISQDPPVDCSQSIHLISQTWQPMTSVSEREAIVLAAGEAQSIQFVFNTRDQPLKIPNPGNAHQAIYGCLELSVTAPGFKVDHVQRELFQMTGSGSGPFDQIRLGAFEGGQPVSLNRHAMFLGRNLW